MPLHAVLTTFRHYLGSRGAAVLRDWLGDFDWTLAARDLPAAPAPAARHLAAAVAQAGAAEAELAQSLLAHADRLHWRRSYGPQDFGAYFYDNYAHVELIGPRGHFACDHLAAGLALYGPGIDYPDHWHVAEEVYIPLSGNGMWSRDGAPHQPRWPGEVIVHGSNQRHATRTDGSAMLALWLWRGGNLAQKSEFRREGGDDGGQ